LLRIAATVRFLTQPYQHGLIRYSAGGGTHYLRITRQETCLHISSGTNRFWVGSQPLKETTMNISKLSIVLLAGIATLVTVTDPSLAAQRKHRASGPAQLRPLLQQRPEPALSGPPLRRSR
jgi:hypothetical protein